MECGSGGNIKKKKNKKNERWTVTHFHFYSRQISGDCPWEEEGIIIPSNVDTTIEILFCAISRREKRKRISNSVDDLAVNGAVRKDGIIRVAEGQADT